MNIFKSNTIRKEVTRVINKQIDKAETLYAEQVKLINKQATEKAEELKNKLKNELLAVQSQAEGEKIDLRTKLITNILNFKFDY